MKKKKKDFPGIKKDLKYFLLSEEGKITKQSIAKIGMGLTMAGIMLHASQSFSQTAHSSSLGGSTDGHQSHTAHSAHSAHSAHGSHGSHGQW